MTYTKNYWMSNIQSIGYSLDWPELNEAVEQYIKSKGDITERYRDSFEWTMDDEDRPHLDITRKVEINRGPTETEHRGMIDIP